MNKTWNYKSNKVIKEFIHVIHWIKNIQSNNMYILYQIEKKKGEKKKNSKEKNKKWEDWEESEREDERKRKVKKKGEGKKENGGDLERGRWVGVLSFWM